MNTFIQKICIKLIKRDSKYIYNVPKMFHLKWMLFIWTFYSSNNPEKGIMLSTKIQHNCLQ